MRANEYKKMQILNKIERDAERCDSLKRQKMELLQTRRDAKDEAGRQKEEIQKKFELIQRKGQLDVSILLFAYCVVATNDDPVWHIGRKVSKDHEHAKTDSYRCAQAATHHEKYEPNVLNALAVRRGAPSHASTGGV